MRQPPPHHPHNHFTTTSPGRELHDTDQPTTALIKDLKQRGLLDDTLIVWGGEFGRTIYSQGTLTATNYGRDHHPRCYSLFMAGGGIKKGTTYGETDDYSYNIVRDPVHVHDLNATLLHLLGFDHEKLTYRFQGRDYRLTDVHGKLVKGVLA
jgi:arylsulfatase A-like enzyme